MGDVVDSPEENMALTGEQIFMCAWLAILVPYGSISSGWFWVRRDVQPIKARQPQLVLVTSIGFVGYTFFSCLGFLLKNGYPCVLTMWSGYIGTIVLCNIYLIRCFILYLNFNLTQHMLELQREHTMRRVPSSNGMVEPPSPMRSSTTREARVSMHIMARAGNRNSSLPALAQQGPQHWYITRKYLSQRFLFNKVFTISFVLLIPPLVFTVVNVDIRTHIGLGCPRTIPDIILLVYTLLYLCVFLYFAYVLRTVFDGFHIKQELKFASITAIFCVILWTVFNVAFKEINNTVFPFSTLFLIAGLAVAMSLSTAWPLYLSLRNPVRIEIITPDEVSTLGELLRHPKGFENFKAFLATEFSVENILFWSEVNNYRAKAGKLIEGDDKDGYMSLLKHAQQIYMNYIIFGAANEINIPGNMLRELAEELKEKYRSEMEREKKQQRDTNKKLSPDEEARERKERIEQIRGTTNIFDRAQDDIFKLMRSDSYERYRNSQMYRDFIQELKDMQGLYDGIPGLGV